MKNTFGNTPAAQRLEILLQNNPLSRRKVSRLLNQYTYKLIRLAGLKDFKTVHTCMILLRNYALSLVDIQKNLDSEVRSYTKNLISCRYREYRKGYEFMVPSKKKNRLNIKH